MLISAVILLQATETAEIPRDQGRAVHAWFLDQVRRHDAALAGRLHDSQGAKPLTCSSLRGIKPAANGDRLQLTPEQPAWLRITTLTPELSSLMMGSILPNLPATLALDGALLRLTGATTDPDEHGWAGRSSYAALLQEHTLALRPPARQVRLHFASPTAFRRGESQHVPVPLPELAVLGWLDRWNAFAGAALPTELRRYALECLVISYYNLRTLPVRFGQAMTIGCVGKCTYRATNPDPYWLRLVQMLAHYSFFCGTGHRTTRGMGQTRWG